MMEDAIYISIVIIIVFAIMFLFQTKKPEIKKKGILIPDEEVTVSSVYKNLVGFKPLSREGRKNGFTEKDAQEDMDRYLKRYYNSVTREHGIEGKNAKRIDFDIGNGKVGIEVKLADSLLKEGESDRLMGQIRKYSKRRYYQNNLLVAIIGNSDHERDTVLHEIQKDILSEGVSWIFLKVPKRRL